MEEQGDDTALVESTVRETRAAPTDIDDLLHPGVKSAYLHTFGDHDADDGDIHGFSKKKDAKGDDGYKHFDSYHKKNSDKYGFEVQSEFGEKDKASVGVDDDEKEGHCEGCLQNDESEAQDGESEAQNEDAEAENEESEVQDGESEAQNEENESEGYTSEGAEENESDDDSYE
ncbi:unnamed protein product [Phaedon cochleariae]|uniref:Uncharacterized protein n=1 Tax=Phaedon cochleariae TaxID=80249 RepID=A0A9P0DB20_PHACE|nr:unnamed protein product [Phaedon cochleariae]